MPCKCTYFLINIATNTLATSFTTTTTPQPQPQPPPRPTTNRPTKTTPPPACLPCTYNKQYAGLVVFKDKEGFDRATAESFQIFGVVIDGVAVTTKPAHRCRTLYVENFEMRTGVQVADAINAVLEPRYTVRADFFAYLF